MSMGTMNWADVLGVEASPLQVASPISAGGPNQSYVAPGFSGGPGTGVGTGPAPALSLVGLALLLVAWRVAVEFGAE